MGSPPQSATEAPSHSTAIHQVGCKPVMTLRLPTGVSQSRTHLVHAQVPSVCFTSLTFATRWEQALHAAQAKGLTGRDCRSPVPILRPKPLPKRSATGEPLGLPGGLDHPLSAESIGRPSSAAQLKQGPHMPPENLPVDQVAIASALYGASASFNPASLLLVAVNLLLLGEKLNREHFPEAKAGQELLYPLLEDPNGPSLYLVSDGEGTSSPPHEHQTWTLIVGIRGRELNTFYQARKQSPGPAAYVSERCVGPGECVLLDPTTIHATSVVGSGPTYHLHLYGRSLASLPAFELRTYQRST